MKNRYLEKLTRDIHDVPWDYDRDLNGIGGWMIIVIIGRFITIVMALVSIPQLMENYGYFSWLDTFVNLSLTVLVPIDVVVNIIILVFIFKRNILFRKIFVVYTIFILAVTVAGMIFLKLAFDTAYTQGLTSFIGAAIWITYLYKSKRVRNTFIYSHLDFIWMVNKENYIDKTENGDDGDDW